MRCTPACLLILLALLHTAAAREVSAQVVTQPPSPTVTPTLLVPALVITAPILSSPVYAGVRTSVAVKVGNAKDGTVISVRPIPVTSAPCTFVVPRATPVVSMTANGTTSVMVPGMFTHPVSSVATTCAFSAEVTAVKKDGSTTTTVVNSSAVPIAPSTVYVVQNTVDWLGKFAFANSLASGDCTGASNGLDGIFKVGLVTSDAGQVIPDLTFRIRSGPFGTSCRWDSQPMLLPEGVRLTRIEIAVLASAKCQAGPAALNDFVGGFQSMENPVAVNGSVIAANPLGAGYVTTGIGTLLIQLNCGKTLSNDGFANLTIKSLTFIGPPNLTGFP